MAESGLIPDQLREQIVAGLPAHCAKICEQILVEMGELMFALAIVVTESDVHTIMIPVPTPETEAAVAAGMRRHLREHGAVAYAVCTEGWLRFTGRDGLSDEAPPSEHPDGVEAVLVMGQTPGGPFHSFFRTMRDADGKIFALGEDLVAGRTPPTTGLFMGLLDPAPQLH